MPSRSFLENQPSTPSTKHQSVVVESNNHTTTSPLTSSLGGSPARTIGDRTPDYPLARAGAMSHYPPHHPSHQPPQHSPSQANAGRDPRYMQQMISTGAHPSHFQGATHHVAYLPPNIPQLYGGAPPGGNNPYGAGSYPPQHQHHGGSPGQHHHAYVIAGYPPGHGHQQGPPPSGGSQYFAVSSYPPPPQGGAYHTHHHPPPHHGGHPQSPHHPHAPRPPHHGHQSGSTPAPVYARHGPPPPGAGQYPPGVMYSQQSMPPRGPGAPPGSSSHPSTVSRSSTHPSEKDLPGHDRQIKIPHEPVPSMEEMQAEREREEEAMEQVLKSVKPIQTDYHLFIEEEKKKFVELAAKDGGDDPYLRNSSLNYRLKAAWEGLDASRREIYLKREELDRKRFMEEEEIANRHCATLTARNSTPTPRKKSQHQSTAEVTVDDEEDEDGETRDETRDETMNKRVREKEETDGNESPTKKERAQQEAEAVEQV